MERVRKILHRILFPPAGLVIISVPAAAALLVYTFAFGGEGTPAAYIAYVFSAWSLTVVCIGIMPAVRRCRRLAHSNQLMHRYLTDMPFKATVSLHASFGVNTLYGVFKLVMGIIYSSLWLITLGVYYMCLANMRFLLLRHVNRNTAGKDLELEWRRYRLCGMLLIPINIALCGLIVLIIHQERGFEYPGYLIYAMALYAFYAAIMAVVNLVRYRRLGSPVLSAAKSINLAAALVSILALETAMMSQFGGEEDQTFRLVMTSSTGGVVFATVLGMALLMIIRATGQLKQIREKNPLP